MEMQTHISRLNSDKCAIDRCQAGSDWSIFHSMLVRTADTNKYLHHLLSSSLSNTPSTLRLEGSSVTSSTLRREGSSVTSSTLRREGSPVTFSTFEGRSEGFPVTSSTPRREVSPVTFSILRRKGSSVTSSTLRREVSPVTSSTSRREAFSATANFMFETRTPEMTSSSAKQTSLSQTTWPHYVAPLPCPCPYSTQQRSPPGGRLLQQLGNMTGIKSGRRSVMTFTFFMLILALTGAQSQARSVGVCRGVPCANGGHLLVDNSVWGHCRCRCPQGFVGPYCQHQIAEKRNTGTSTNVDNRRLARSEALERIRLRLLVLSRRIALSEAQVTNEPNMADNNSDDTADEEISSRSMGQDTSLDSDRSNRPRRAWYSKWSKR